MIASCHLSTIIRINLFLNFHLGGIGQKYRPSFSRFSVNLPRSVELVYHLLILGHDHSELTVVLASASPARDAVFTVLTSGSRRARAPGLRTFDPTSAATLRMVGDDGGAVRDVFTASHTLIVVPGFEELERVRGKIQTFVWAAAVRFR